ncbi:MAG: cytochrome c family protein [Pseudomonadota bacterium]
MKTILGLGAALMTIAGAASAQEYADFTGDAAKGKRVFTKCMSCHAVKEGQNRVGPSLYGIVGREAGKVEKFRYSEANADSGITWTEEVLFEYLADPRGYLPGTKMIFNGLPKPQDRADVIAYLKSVPEDN